MNSNTKCHGDFDAGIVQPKEGTAKIFQRYLLVGSTATNLNRTSRLLGKYGLRAYGQGLQHTKAINQFLSQLSSFSSLYY